MTVQRKVRQQILQDLRLLHQPLPHNLSKVGAEFVVVSSLEEVPKAPPVLVLQLLSEFEVGVRNLEQLLLLVGNRLWFERPLISRPRGRDPSLVPRIVVEPDDVAVEVGHELDPAGPVPDHGHSLAGGIKRRVPVRRVPQDALMVGKSRILRQTPGVEHEVELLHNQLVVL